jgi:hypothetical protein
MREIIPRRLWLGNASDVRDLRRIHDLGVAAIVDLALEESVPQLTRDLIYCRFPLVDGSGNSPEDVLKHLTAGNPHDVSPPLWSEVMDVYNELVD